MRKVVIAGALVAALFCVRDVDAADDVAATIRADVDALVRMLAAPGWRRTRDDGPSPTQRVNRLIAAGDGKLKPALDEAWKVVTTWTAGEPYRAATKQLIRSLYSLTEAGKPPPGKSELAEEDGILRARGGDPNAGFGFTSQRGFGRSRDESTPPFASLIKGGKLRKATKPDAKKALATLDAGKVAEAERFAVAQAVGESCAVNKQAMADLLRRFDADPANQWLLTALAWSGSPDAENPLRMEVVSLASRVAEGRSAASPILSTACWALGHLRPAALTEEIGKMTPAEREAALASAGFDVSVAFDLAALEKAVEPATKEEVLESVCKRLSAREWDRSASGATTTSLVKLLASNLAGASDALRPQILGAAESLLYAGWRGDASHTSHGMGDTKEAKVTGERLGPYPGMDATLAAIATDLGKGDLAFSDSEPSIYDLEGRPGWTETKRLLSEVKCPDPTMGETAPGDCASVRLSGEFVGEWLRLTLTNAGALPIAVNPVALRYATAEFTTHEFKGGPAGARTYTQLKLTLGFMHGGPVTPATRLVTLTPKAAHTWMVTVRPEHRDAGHVCVDLTDGFSVSGKTPVAPFARFDTTWVK